MWLKLGISETALAAWFGWSASYASVVVRQVLPFLQTCLEKTAWDAPRQVVARTHIHPYKQAYGDDIVEILDGTEGRVETPSDADVRHVCWSQYKHDYTLTPGPPPPPRISGSVGVGTKWNSGLQLLFKELDSGD